MPSKIDTLSWHSSDLSGALTTCGSFINFGPLVTVTLLHLDSCSIRNTRPPPVTTVTFPSPSPVGLKCSQGTQYESTFVGAYITESYELFVRAKTAPYTYGRVVFRDYETQKPTRRSVHLIL